MNEFTEVEQFDTSVLAPTPSFEDMARECSALMDEVEAEGGAHTSDEGDPRMVRISELATLISYFAPELLDKRFQ